LTWYHFFKFLYVSFAAIWVGGGAVTRFFALRAMRDKTGVRHESGASSSCRGSTS
jgi:hypothetical protein